MIYHKEARRGQFDPTRWFLFTSDSEEELFAFMDRNKISRNRYFPGVGCLVRRMGLIPSELAKITCLEEIIYLPF